MFLSMRSGVVCAVFRACAVLGLGLGLAACGGKILVVAGDGGDDAPASSATGTGGDDASPGGDFGVCPATAPTIGSSCSEPGHGCAYYEQNGAATVSCQALLCDASGHWQASSTGC